MNNDRMKFDLGTAISAIGMVGLFALGATVMVFVDHEHHVRCRASYDFINASEVCGKKDVISKTGYASMQGKLETYIATEETVGHISLAAVYYRDLEDGPVLGINESDDFAPASLLKVPLALVYLTQAERNPAILTEQLSVANPQWNFSEYFRPSETIDPHTPHTVEDLLMHMLVYSDNNAYGVLQTHLYESGQKDLIPQTFLELGFIDPDDISDEVLSVRRYAGIFRALYNISYLNASLSEKILSWLAASEFELGIVAGVPNGTVVAHKFGERFTDDGTKQLHDCGIVYYPRNPYLLCVMTKGTNFDDLTTVISRISQIVYEEVDSRRL
jgi:beta-lactamase class A